MFKILAYILSAILTYSLAQGQAPVVYGPQPAPVPLTFTLWKQQQVAEAQTQLQKLTGRRGSDKKEIARAKETLANAGELTVEEYVSVYLTTLQGNRLSLVNLSEKLTKDETADIISSLLNRIDAERKQSVPVATSGTNNLIK